MTKTVNLKVWDLTPLEVAELSERQLKKLGVKKLLAELSEMLGEQIKSEQAWWEGIVVRLQIPAEFRFRLIVNEEIGKVWVMGQVPELKEKEQEVFIRDATK